jgi:hypothetical protein
LERKRILETLSGVGVQAILLERKIPFDPENDSKESLVRKVIVTDQKKGKKTGHMVTHQHSDSCGSGCAGSAHFVKTRVAPGADYIDKRCQHGSQRLLETLQSYQDEMLSASMRIMISYDARKETIEFTPAFILRYSMIAGVHFVDYHELSCPTLTNTTNALERCSSFIIG